QSPRLQSRARALDRIPHRRLSGNLFRHRQLRAALRRNAEAIRAALCPAERTESLSGQRGFKDRQDHSTRARKQRERVMPKNISFPRIEGLSSRQAHADLPQGTFERELGREGFYGPATHMYHRHPPTGWTSWEGPLRPRAFDLTRLETDSHSNTSQLPWDAPV